MHYWVHIYNSNLHLCNAFWSCRCTERLPAGRFTFVPGGATYGHNLQQDSKFGIRHSQKPWATRGPWKAGPYTWDYQLNATFLECKWSFCNKREELSSNWQAWTVAARRPKLLDYTMGILQVILGKSVVFAVWCSSFRISHSLKTMHCPTGRI